ncbi:S-adenosyl-L-methionine-dependent methyltransferase [Xylaria castorea]|nr:S-adenosyl-L-methionine-dependent methyltransferase [Xylaria castorea]
MIKDILNASKADSAGRRKILDGVSELQLQLKTPHDTLSRLSAARIGADLGIFKTLKESEQPLSTTALSQKTNAAPLVLGRILRCLASVGMIQEVARDSFTTNAITKTLAYPGYEGGIHSSLFRQCWPYQISRCEQRHQFSLPKAFSTDLPAFAWLPTQPERFAPVQQVMTVQGASVVPWFSVFPFEKELGNFTDAHAFVNVGGGFGHQSLALLKVFPVLHGKIYLEALPQTFEELPFKLDGIEPKPHNFFEGQPIKGARFYYLRNILSEHLMNACRPDSQILIDEMVLPDSGVLWEATTIDLTLMASFGSRERTTAQWHALLGAAGLKVPRIDIYQARRQDSIIKAIAK